MKVFILILLPLFLSSTFTFADEKILTEKINKAQKPKLEAIKFLVASLSKQPLWENGMFFPLSLPSTASYDQLAAAYIEKANFKLGKLHDYDINETATCKIPPNSDRIFNIVRISSDQGGKFLIFRYETNHWWTKNYDAKEEYLKAVAEQGAAANP